MEGFWNGGKVRAEERDRERERARERKECFRRMVFGRGLSFLGGGISPCFKNDIWAAVLGIGPCLRMNLGYCFGEIQEPDCLLILIVYSPHDNNNNNKKKKKKRKEMEDQYIPTWGNREEWKSKQEVFNSHRGSGKASPSIGRKLR